MYGVPGLPIFQVGVTIDTADSAPPATLGRAHLAALRAWLQGLPLASIAGQWLAVDADTVPDSTEALALIHAIRDALIQRAYQHQLPDLVQALVAPQRSGAGMDRAVAAVHVLERLGTPAPQPAHAVTLWLALPLARRLQEAGIATLGELMALCNERGHSWWRRVPRIGPKAAATIVRVLGAHAATLGQLGAHVTGVLLSTLASAPASVLAPGAAAPPLEAMCLPQALDGCAGRNRAEPLRCRIEASNDYEAIQTWLSLWPTDSPTYRAYRKEAERFLAWAIIERGTAFSDLLSEDCVAYRAFLAQEEFGPRWCGPRVARHLPSWRPFVGRLRPRSRQYAEQVLSALCAWLAGRRYLDSNPWEGVPQLRVAGISIDVERAIPTPVWERLHAWLDEQAEDSAYRRVQRAAIVLLHDSGLRCFEAATARCDDLRPAQDIPGLWGELRVVGKGTKERYVPISEHTFDALTAHWRDRGLDDQPPVGGLLLSPLEVVSTPRARAKAEAGRIGYSARGLRCLVARVEQDFRQWLAAHPSAGMVDTVHLHPHAFRHAFATDALAAGVPQDVVQACLGHSSSTMTAIYTKAGQKRRQAEIGRWFAQDAQGRGRIE